MPSSYSRRVRRLIAQGLVNPKDPTELTSKGERLAEERHDPHWSDAAPEFDAYGDYGYDPGDDRPA